MGDITGFMSMFNIIIGIFALYSAITGKGPAFKNDYPQEIKEGSAKMMRTFCWIIGPIILISGIAEYLIPEYSMIAYWISMPIIVGSIIIYLIIFYRKFGKALKADKNKRKF